MAETGQDDRRRELAETTDPRATRTRDQIVVACAALLEEGRSLSVTAICARAGVGRSTFYTHFGASTDVAIEVVDRIFDEVASRDIERRCDSSLPRSAITRVGLHEMIVALRTQQRYLRNILSAPAAERVRERLAEEISLNVRPSILAERPDAGEGYLRTVGDFIAGGAVSALLSWLDDPQGRPEDELVDTIVGILPGWLAGEPRE
jgi:AcrR family transcriptional regulator